MPATDTSAQAANRKQRRLHITWVTAGERRLVTRALHQAGFSNRHIARLLEVSPTTVCNDLAR